MMKDAYHIRLICYPLISLKTTHHVEFVQLRPPTELRLPDKQSFPPLSVGPFVRHSRIPAVLAKTITMITAAAADRAASSLSSRLSFLLTNSRGFCVWAAE